MKIYQFIPYLLIILTFFSGCSSDTRITSLVHDGYDRIQLIHKVSEVEGTEVVTAQGYTHPSELSADQLKMVLEALQVQKKAFFKWGAPEPLLLDEEIAKLAPRLAQALQKATGDQWIYFATAAEKPGFLLDRVRMTDGICFMEEGRLNLVFSNINFEIRGDDAELKDGDPRLHPPELFYQFVVDRESGFDHPAIDETKPGLSEKKPQWLVFELDTFLKSNPGQMDKEKAKSSSADDPAKRLMQLKRLHEQNLITDEEYQQKRQQILGEL